VTNRPSARFGWALLAGGCAMLAGALAWGFLEYWTDRPLIVLPIPMAIVVGFAVDRVRPRDIRGPVASAVFAVLGCALGPFVLNMLMGLVHSHATPAFLLSHPANLAGAYLYAVGGRFGALGFLGWLLAAFIAFMIPLSHSIVIIPSGEGDTGTTRPPNA
jgi:hypothetical protein